MASLALAVAALIALTGCGNARTTASLGASVTPGVLQWVHYPAYGVTIRAPQKWQVSRGQPPLVATMSLSDAVATLWSYPRHLPPPASAAALALARRQLIAAARRRDPTLQLIRSSVSLLDGFPAVELDAFEHVNGRPRRVRSTHVFTAGAEVVLDEYAPPQRFHAVDHAVFSPLKRSLRVGSASGA